jgi:hypothetical protein
MMRTWGLRIVAAGAVCALLAVVAVALLTGAGPAAALCPRVVRAFAAMPEPAGVELRDGDELQIDDQRSVFVGMGPRLAADYRLDIRGEGIVEQIGTAFEWTERRCGRDVEGYRFVVVRAVGPGDATVIVRIPDVAPRELHVRVVQ